MIVINLKTCNITVCLVLLMLWVTIDLFGQSIIYKNKALFLYQWFDWKRARICATLADGGWTCMDAFCLLGILQHWSADQTAECWAGDCCVSVGVLVWMDGSRWLFMFKCFDIKLDFGLLTTSLCLYVACLSLKESTESGAVITASAIMTVTLWTVVALLPFIYVLF